MHRLRAAGRGRCRKIRIGKAPDRNSVSTRVAVAFPKDAGAAIGAKVEADLKAAIGGAAIDLLVALDPHLVLLPRAAVMDDCARATLAPPAVADINAGRVPALDRPSVS